MATHFLVNVCTLNITQVLCLHSLGDLIAYLCLFVCFVLYADQLDLRMSDSTFSTVEFATRICIRLRTSSKNPFTPWFLGKLDNI